MKATEQFYPVILYKVVLTFFSMDQIQKLTILVKAIEQYFRDTVQLYCRFFLTKMCFLVVPPMQINLCFPNGNLLKVYNRDLGGKTLTNLFVASNIDKLDNKVNSSGKISLKNQHGEVLTVKYVVITVPLTILKDGDINFIPALPANKKRAIDAIQMRGALKIVCRFKLQFWPDKLNVIYAVRGFVSQIWTTHVTHQTVMTGAT